MTDTILDLLDHGSDGEPRWVMLDAVDAPAAARLVHLVATEAERRGYVALGADRFPAAVRTLPDEMRHRTFALLHTLDAGAPPDASALTLASALNPRPHVLVTIVISRTRARRPPLLREARAAYNAGRDHASPWSADAEKYLARAQQAFAMARAGRHAPAVRMLREAAAALVRRKESRAAARATMQLGRVLLERGRADDAAATFAEAVTYLDPVHPQDAAVARVWIASARTDAGRLTEAEGLLRATRLAGVLPEGTTRVWADAVLARCLVWQDRCAEAAQLLDGAIHVDGDADPQLAVPILSTQSRVHVALGRVFDGGQRARAALEWAQRAEEAVLQLVAGVAHLRVLVSTGDLDLAAERRSALLAQARAHHQPVHALRVRLLWAETLQKAGRSSDATRELERCARLARAAPELLKRRLHVLVNGAPKRSGTAGSESSHGAWVVELLRIVQEEDDDRAAVQKVLESVCGRVRAGRVEVQSANGGALSTIVSAGTGLASRLGQRALEAGIPIGPELRDGVWQTAMPIRIGHRLPGVMTCRWPLGREALAGAVEQIELAAAVVAPRVDIVLAARAAAASAAASVPELIGQSDAMVDVRRAIARAAVAPFSVLVEGESGAGKELVARAIHHLSPRRDRRFCDINCAALPDDLVEAELFGHAKGAFTGALVERRGLFEEASGGTLFLDELPDLSLRSQAKLLRVVQQGEIRRVGESFPRRIDVRLVTATNRAMAGEVAAGRFRQDLLYRLDVLRISIPPLRDRPVDIPLLAQRFWETAAQRAGTRAALSHGVLAALARYQWPGNVRELQNVIAALAVAAPERGIVRPSLLPPTITGALPSGSPERLVEARQQFERRFIEIALARAGGSRAKAAVQLGVTRQGLMKLMARLRLSVGEPNS